MTSNEEFPIGRLEGAPSDDIGWHFGVPIAGNRNNVQCKLCQKIIRGGITRLKQHIAHDKGQVAGCPRVTSFVRENMMKLLKDRKEKKIDFRKRKEEFESRLREDDEEDSDEEMRIASQQSIRSQREWEDRQRFRQQTEGSNNIYESGGSSRMSVSQTSRKEDATFALRSTNVDLVRSKSMKQPKIGGGLMKTLKKKLGEAVSKFIIYERLPMNLSNSPWLHNLIIAAAEVGPSVKCPTPYEVSDVYLEAEYKSMQEWISKLKTTWKEKGVTIMCDGWTDSVNHTHIMNFLVYCSKGTIFLKSIDASNVDSRNTDYYFQLLDKVVDEVGEEFVIQVVTDNEKALKAAGQKLMEKRQHLYWTACAAHCLDLCLEDIGKKKNVQKLLSDAKVVTTFIYNHTWIVNLMKKYTGGREIVRPGVTRFATQFLQLQAIVQQKQGLRNMFNSEEFRRSKFGRDKNGLAFEARQIVIGNDFWSKANDILKVFEPLVKVLRLVDGDEKPTMGFIYEAIDRAKQSIQKSSRYYSQYQEIIDKRWRFMHSDLHSAGYFLNPQFQYGVEHGSDVYRETFEGTKKVIMKLERNMDDQIKALNSLVLFKDMGETFATPQAQRAWSRMNPGKYSFFLSL
ncbi:uncharacterized protein LOC109806220 [Cajanus cajan]|uniref:uncharacterized protein LOC109806220 n=1 Tax=Cajanus cajan TaxID=3821 RepID=UPI0010FAD09E|nr:uncharacterized protein LOC109806220 [Cajanus cajan]